MRARVNNITIDIVQDDIFNLEVAGLVIPTDSNLTVNPLLARKAGARVQVECSQIGWCEVGSAAVTSGGLMPIEKIIHAVGPRWGEGSERGKLASVTWKALNLAEENQLKTIALPAISTGILGYPLENCATTMLTQIIDFTFEKLKHVKTIIICLESDLAVETFTEEFKRQIDDLKQTGEGKVRV